MRTDHNPAERTTKVTGLTGSNVVALKVAVEKGVLDADAVTITATTATFAGGPATALEALTVARDGLARIFGTRGHPVASIPAVRRKLEAQL